jgi:hypothetical protein
VRSPAAPSVFLVMGISNIKRPILFDSLTRIEQLIDEIHFGVEQHYILSERTLRIARSPSRRSNSFLETP